MDGRRRPARPPPGPPQAAHQLHRLGERVLLAGEPLHESPAPHLAAQLLSAQDPHQIPPGERDALALEQPPEDEAVAREELPGHELRGALLRERRTLAHLARIARRLPEAR